MKGSPLAEGRERPKRTIGKTIKKDLNFNGLIVNVIYNRKIWRYLIHVANPT